MRVLQSETNLMMMTFWTKGTLLGVPEADIDEAAGEIPGPAIMLMAGLAAPLETAAVAAAPVGPEGAAAPAVSVLCLWNVANWKARFTSQPCWST